MSNRRKHIERALQATAEDASGSFEYAREIGSLIGTEIADKAVNEIGGIIDRLNDFTPQRFKDISEGIAPFANPDIFKRLLKRQLEYYNLLAHGEQETAFERLVNSEIYLDMPEGEILKIRKPCRDEAGKLAGLYGDGLSDEDIRTRFFVGMSKESAMQYGLQSSSLLTPEAIDFIALTEKDDVVGHAGYVYDEEGEASLHIVLHKHWRRKTANGDRISEVMFSRSLAAAMLDPRVAKVHAEALNENAGIHRLLDSEMLPRGAQRHNEDSYSVVSITKCIESPDDLV